MTIHEISCKAKEYCEIMSFIKQLEDEAEALKVAMIEELNARNTDMLQTDICTVRLSKYRSTRIDTTRLKKELPDVADIYTKVTEMSRFAVTF